MTLLQAGEVLHIGILLFDKVEDLDFCGPLETFAVASELKARTIQAEQGPFNVFTIAEQGGVVTTHSKLLVQPHFSFADHPPIDILIIPGGNVTEQAQNANVLNWLKKVVEKTQITASVCTGSFFLGEMGLLDGKRVTTHWASLKYLTAMYPQAQVQQGVRWVDEGRIITAAGVSAGIDMSLHLVERYLGRDLAETTAHYIEYKWQEN